jgi:hypothetical protein
MANDQDTLILEVQDALRSLKTNTSNPSQDQLLSLKSTAYSNIVRGHAYKKNRPQLNIGKLNRILEINTTDKTAWVEPRVTMEQLVEATQKHGLVPPVLPEFKTITVGGAICGAAIESSSHRYGQFNDNCLEYEILIGNGDIVKASPEENADLFYGISGSYGTLGSILRVKMKLISSEPWVELTYRRFDDISQAMSYISNLHHNKSGPEYIEGLVYNRSFTVVISGIPRKNPPQHNEKSLSLSRSWSPNYFQHIFSATKKLNNQSVITTVISTPDYLFRHDRGAFWMGAYALHGWLLLMYTLERIIKIPENVRKHLIQKIEQGPWTPKLPGVVFRTLFGWATTSQRLYAVLHTGNEHWFEEQFVIQDFYIPEKNAPRFIHHILKEYAISPLWLCPVKGTSTSQFLAPHYNDKKQLFIDVGVYGKSKGGISGPTANQNLENLTQEMGGRKMLYTHSCYDKNVFWSIYSENAYRALRKKYHADGVFLDITDKVLG